MLLPSYNKVIKLMGNQFEFTSCHHDEALCRGAVSAGIDEVKRIVKLLTTFSDTIYTAQINQ